VKNMYMMFYNAASFNQNLSKWNFVENSNNMFLLSGILDEDKKPSKARSTRDSDTLSRALFGQPSLRSYV
jgi:hypothetical protein